MIKEKIKNIVRSENRKTIIYNFFSLSVLQGLNMFLPLVTMPYIIKVIGVDYYGLLSFAIALCLYFQIVTDYGFNLTATKDISQNTEDKEKIRAIYNEVTSARIMLMLLCAVIYGILVFSISSFREEKLVFFLTFGMVVGQSIFPVWFFQGMQKMKYITYINVVSKTLFTAAIFLFVKKQEDYWMVPFFTSLGFIISGFLSTIYVERNFDIKYEVSSFQKVKAHLKSGKYVFLSQLKMSLFSNTNLIILGFLGGNTALGYFTAAEKIMRALAALQIPVVNALYPHISKTIAESKQNAYNTIKKVAGAGSVIYLAVLAAVFIFAPHIVEFVFDKESANTALLLRIIVFAPLFIFLNNLYGTQLLLNLNKDKLFFSILLVTAAFNIALIFPLTYFFNEVGTAITVIITEVFLCLAMYVYALKEKGKNHG